MPTRRPMLSELMQLHVSILGLVEKGLAYAFPARDPLDPIIRAACYCTAEEKAGAIPLAELRQIYRECERAFVACDN